MAIIMDTIFSSIENVSDPQKSLYFVLPSDVSFPLMQGILKDENDINMLGEDFRLAYQQRRGNELSEES